MDWIHFGSQETFRSDVLLTQHKAWWFPGPSPRTLNSLVQVSWPQMCNSLSTSHILKLKKVRQEAIYSGDKSSFIFLPQWLQPFCNLRSAGHRQSSQQSFSRRCWYCRLGSMYIWCIEQHIFAKGDFANDITRRKIGWPRNQYFMVWRAKNHILVSYIFLRVSLYLFSNKSNGSRPTGRGETSVRGGCVE